MLPLIALAVASCTSSMRIEKQLTLTDQQLLALDVFPEPQETTPRTQADAFEVNADMARFLAANISTRSDERIFDDLIEAMESFGIRYLAYDNQTLTAAEAFEEHRGNCLTFTNLFLVMARRVGLRAYFQEVRIPPDWLIQGDMMVLRRHINVRVRLMGRVAEGFGQRVVDFGDETIPASYIDTANRVISDERAMAHFYNNWAAESLADGDSNLAFAYVRKSLLEGDVDFAPAWILVGVMYQRAGREGRAEQAYLRALQAEPDETAALSNLQRLYVRQGRSDLADHYDDLVSSHRQRNPYFRLAEARDAYAQGDFRTAIKQLRKAIRLKPDDADLHFLLADAFAAEGDLEKAEHYRREGNKLAGIDGDNRSRGLVKPKAPIY